MHPRQICPFPFLIHTLGMTMYPTTSLLNFFGNFFPFVCSFAEHTHWALYLAINWLVIITKILVFGRFVHHVMEYSLDMQSFLNHFIVVESSFVVCAYFILNVFIFQLLLLLLKDCHVHWYEGENVWNYRQTLYSKT